VAKAEVLLWLHTALGHQLSMINTSRTISNNCLWHQIKVWRAFSSNRHWNSLQYCSWARCVVVYKSSFWKRMCEWACDNWRIQLSYSEVEVTDKCAFCEGCLQNLGTVVMI